MHTFSYFFILNMHRWLAYESNCISCISSVCAFVMHLALYIYAYVKGELHLKSLPKIFIITPYVLSSSKRGRLLAQRPLSLSFDDYKPYKVRN